MGSVKQLVSVMCLLPSSALQLQFNSLSLGCSLLEKKETSFKLYQASSSLGLELIINSLSFRSHSFVSKQALAD